MHMKVETLTEIAKRLSRTEKPSYYKKDIMPGARKQNGDQSAGTLLRILGILRKKEGNKE